MDQKTEPLIEMRGRIQKNIKPHLEIQGYIQESILFFLPFWMIDENGLQTDRPTNERTDGHKEQRAYVQSLL